MTLVFPFFSLPLSLPFTGISLRNSSSRIEETSRSIPNMRFKVASCTQTSALSAESCTSVSIASNPRRAAQTNDARVFSGASDWQPRCAMKNGFSVFSRSRNPAFCVSAPANSGATTINNRPILVLNVISLNSFFASVLTII